MAGYFGTNGVRGRFDVLGPELAMKIAKATGIYFNRGKILIARDGRLTGECLKYAIIAGLQSVGCEVVDMDYAPAPTAEFMIKKLKADGLIIITASHNPPEWNAMKVIDGNGVTVSSERGEQIEGLVEENSAIEWSRVGKLVLCKNGIRTYIDAIKKQIDNSRTGNRKQVTGHRKLKVVLDCGNGMACLMAPELFKELGYDVVMLNGNVDGHFPGRLSEPSKANVKELLELVVKEKADAGFAWDGDGDRLIAVDEKGEYVIGDKVFALSVLLKLKQKKGDIVTTVATSKAAEDVAKKSGCRVAYVRIGAPYLSEEMIKGKAVIGGEEVGGVIWPEVSLAKDGFMTAVKIAEALHEKPLSKWINMIPHYCNSKTKITANAKEKKKIVDGIRNYAKKEKLDTIEVDGVRISLENAWVIVRASGTEDYVRVFAEAKNEEQAKELMEKYTKIAETFQ
jgi:phosphomannomutase/phosphoglucomutase